LRLALDQTVGVVNGRGHQLGGFVAGIVKHQALVAGTGVEVVVADMVKALGDVIALLVVGHQHRTAFVVNAVVRVVAAMAFECVACDLDVVDGGVGGDFTCQQDQAEGQCRSTESVHTHHHQTIGQVHCDRRLVARFGG